MKIMGLDLGNKTLGVAISDSTGFLSSGYPTIRFQNRDFASALAQVFEVITANKVEKIVLGLPKNMDGSLGSQAEISMDFKKKLEDKTGIEVILFDERLTSKLALNTMIMGNENRKTRKENIDEMAAKIILQDYLDKIRR